MTKTVEDFDIFSLSVIQDKAATLYSYGEEDTYIYVGSDKYVIPLNTMALSRSGDYPLSEKFLSFRFSEEIKLDGYMKVFQMDEHYMVLFATEKFTRLEGEDEDAVNDIILLKVGNALVDVEKLS